MSEARKRKSKQVLDVFEVDDQTWFYIYPRKLELVREVYSPTGVLLKTEVFSVPLDIIRRAIAAQDGTAEKS